jgi:hypothetical protein
MRYYSVGNNQGVAAPRLLTTTTGSGGYALAASPLQAQMGVQYDTGDWIEGALPSIGSQFNTSNPLESGNEFQVPVSMNMIGVYSVLNPLAAGATMAMNIYQGTSNLTPINTLNVGAFWFWENAGGGWVERYFPTPTLLQANTSYLISYMPSVAAIQYFTQGIQSIDQIPFPGALGLRQRSAPAGWSGLNPGSIFSMIPILDLASIPAGSANNNLDGGITQ